MTNLDKNILLYEYNTNIINNKLSPWLNVNNTNEKHITSFLPLIYKNKKMYIIVLNDIQILYSKCEIINTNIQLKLNYYSNYLKLASFKYDTNISDVISNISTDDELIDSKESINYINFDNEDYIINLSDIEKLDLYHPYGEYELNNNTLIFETYDELSNFPFILIKSIINNNFDYIQEGMFIKKNNKLIGLVFSINNTDTYVEDITIIPIISILTFLKKKNLYSLNNKDINDIDNIFSKYIKYNKIKCKKNNNIYFKDINIYIPFITYLLYLGYYYIQLETDKLHLVCIDSKINIKLKTVIHYNKNNIYIINPNILMYKWYMLNNITPGCFIFMNYLDGIILKNKIMIDKSNSQIYLIINEINKKSIKKDMIIDIMDIDNNKITYTIL